MALGLSQYGSITGRRYPKHYVERINAQTDYLPQYIAAKENREFAAQDLKMREAHFQQQQALQEKVLREARKREQQEMGLTAGKLGLNVAMNTEDATIGDVASDIKSAVGMRPTGALPDASAKQGPFGAWGDAASRAASRTGGFSSEKTGFMDTARDIFGGLQIGDIVSSGLVGLGASKIVDDDSSNFKKIGMGAGAGALMNFIGGLGGGGNSLYDAVVGGIFGGLGGGLGGLF